MTKGSWSVLDHQLGKIVYGNSPANPEDYIYRPPKLGWKASSDGDMPGPIVSNCVGSLESTAPLFSGNDASNIGQLIERPVTTALLGVIFAVAYYLWAYKIDPSAVAYSFEAVVHRGEYWRTVTASFAHFDLLHLGFNAMSLYQLGMLESIFGSATFLYLNLSLVLLTMLICTAIYHVLIHRYGRSELASQQAVGYSCVLFAWMVALSVRLKQYCPIFFLPSLCVDTWFIPLPSALTQWLGAPGIPVNLGPFLLLVVTKLLIPRSSFIGHLSGIVIGYPLAWGMLNWLGLPLTLSCLAGAWVVGERVYVWTFPGYAAANIDLEGVLSAVVLRHYKIVRILSVFIICSVPVGVYLMGLGQLVPRAVLAFLCWSAAHANRVEALLTSGPAKETCGRLMVVTVWFSAGMLLYDACNLAGTLAGWQLLVGSGLYVGYVRLNMQFCSFMLMVQGLYTALLFSNVVEARGAVPLLTRLGCGLEAVVQDLRLLTLPCSACERLLPHHATGGVAPFSGTSYRLVSTDDGEGRHSNGSSSGIVHV